MTRCNAIQGRLRALLDGELTEEERRRVRLHVETCASCQAEFGRMRDTVGLLRALPQEDAPPHFVAGLQVRLRSIHNPPPRPAWWRLVDRFRVSPPLRWALGAGGAFVLAAVVLGIALLAPRMSVAEIAQRAEISWASITDFECSISVSGMYRGRERWFQQKLWYRRPGVYRLETALDYPLLTLVNRQRVLHYLPGGTWMGKGPLVIVRPRKPGEDQLPFPFGLAWPSGPNAGMDQLLRQLREDRNAVLEGTATTGDQEAYVVSFTAFPPSGRQQEQIRMWIDQQTFLPLRIIRDRDANNHLVFETQQVQVNNRLLPSDTFEFQAPPGAVVIRGDVDPHVFGLRPRRVVEYDTQPALTAQQLALEMSSAVPFTPLMPDYLPENYRLVRVNRLNGYSISAYWIDDRPGRPAHVIKLVLHAASEPAPLEVERGRRVQLGEARQPRWGRVASGDKPFDYHYISWRTEGTRATLFVAGLSESVALRIARSAGPVLAEADPDASIEEGENAPSTPPAEPRAPQSIPPESAPVPADPGPIGPPMLSEMLQDADHAPDDPARLREHWLHGSNPHSERWGGPWRARRSRR